jgi:hypothetical protein
MNAENSGMKCMEAPASAESSVMKLRSDSKRKNSEWGF